MSAPIARRAVDAIRAELAGPIDRCDGQAAVAVLQAWSARGYQTEADLVMAEFIAAGLADLLTA